MNTEQEIRAKAMEIVVANIDSLFREGRESAGKPDRTNHPAAMLDDALSLAPFVADYITRGKFNREFLLNLCPGGEYADQISHVRD